MPPTGPQIASRTTEADTCRQYIVPKHQAAGWDSKPHSIAKHRQFPAGRIVLARTSKPFFPSWWLGE